MAGKPFRPPPRPPIPPDFGIPSSDLPMTSPNFPPLLPLSPRSSFTSNRFFYEFPLDSSFDLY
ncbi:unnamed protein product [Brassica oleracea]